MLPFFLALSPLLRSLFIILAASLFVQLSFYFLVYLRVAARKTRPLTNEPNQNEPPISVVICARNEEVALEKFLPTVLEQDYPQFEVVVVNDCSSDNTEFVLMQFQKLYPNLKTTTINPDRKFLHGKKLALTVGIKAAQYEWLVLTDADCQPVSCHWLKTMARNFKGNTEVVIGYGGYMKQKGFLNRLIRFDAFFIGINYLGMALMGRPYMGVGRNLAYKKELFFRNRGFASHSYLHSGDDDLFIHEVANRKNSAVEIDAKSHTLSTPNETLEGWITQKRRHISTSPRYRKSVKLTLFLEPFSRMLFWGSGATLLALSVLPWVVAGTLIFRLIVSAFILGFSMKRLKENNLFFIAFLYDLFSPFLYIWLAIANQLNKKRFRWN